MRKYVLLICVNPFMGSDQLTMSHPVGGAFPSISIASAGSNKRLFIEPVS